MTCRNGRPSNNDVESDVPLDRWLVGGWVCGFESCINVFRVLPYVSFSCKVSRRHFKVHIDSYVYGDFQFVPSLKFSRPVDLLPL